MSLRTALIATFPITGLDELADLNVVLEPHEYRTDEVDPDFPHLVVRIVLWDGDHLTGIKSIRDVIEQSILVPPIWNHTPERINNFVIAWKKVVTEVLGKEQSRPGYPQDYFHFDPLSKKTFHTIAHFESALRAKTRLGRYL